VDVLSDLYEVTGVQRRPFFRPGVDYMKTLEDYAYVAAQADAADDNLRRLASLQEGLSIEPSVADIRNAVATPRMMDEDDGVEPHDGPTGSEELDA